MIVVKVRVDKMNTPLYVVGYYALPGRLDEIFKTADTREPNQRTGERKLNPILRGLQQATKKLRRLTDRLNLQVRQ